MKFSYELKAGTARKPAAHILTIPIGQPKAEAGLEAFRAIADGDERRGQEALSRLAEVYGATFGNEATRVALVDALLRLEQPLLHATAAETTAALFKPAQQPGRGVRVDRRAPRPGM